MATVVSVPHLVIVNRKHFVGVRLCGAGRGGELRVACARVVRAVADEGGACEDRGVPSRGQERAGGQDGGGERVRGHGVGLCDDGKHRDIEGERGRKVLLRRSIDAGARAHAEHEAVRQQARHAYTTLRHDLPAGVSLSGVSRLRVAVYGADTSACGATVWHQQQRDMYRHMHAGMHHGVNEYTGGPAAAVTQARTSLIARLSRRHQPNDSCDRVGLGPFPTGCQMLVHVGVSGGQVVRRVVCCACCACWGRGGAPYRAVLKKREWPQRSMKCSSLCASVLSSAAVGAATEL